MKLAKRPLACAGVSYVYSIQVGVALFNRHAHATHCNTINESNGCEKQFHTFGYSASFSAGPKIRRSKWVNLSSNADTLSSAIFVLLLEWSFTNPACTKFFTYLLSVGWWTGRLASSSASVVHIARVVAVIGVLEGVDRLYIYNCRREMIPTVDRTLTEDWSFFC